MTIIEKITIYHSIFILILKI